MLVIHAKVTESPFIHKGGGLSSIAFPVFDLAKIISGITMLDRSVLDLQSISGLSALAGITSHLGYFIRAEHQLHAPLYIEFGVAAFFGIIMVLLKETHMGLSVALTNTAWMTLSYLCSLYTSMLLYRQYFNPLRHSLGPTLMRLTYWDIFIGVGSWTTTANLISFIKLTAISPVQAETSSLYLGRLPCQYSWVQNPSSSRAPGSTSRSQIRV